MKNPRWRANILTGGITIRITGSLINAAAILLGGAAGLLAKGRISEKISENITRAMGLCVCVIGFSGAIKGDFMLLVASLALGALTGELLDIEGALNRLGLFLQEKLSGNQGNSKFAEGFVMATLLFCVGAMAVVGAIDSGLKNDHTVLMTKSMIDGVSAMVIASLYGFGTLLSAAAILLYEGSIEIFARYLQNVLTADLITQISAAGSVMIIGIGFNMALSGVRIRVANLLPGLIFAVGYYYLFMR